MEQFSDLLKTRLKDPAYDYRQDSFLLFLKTPVRNYKESPTSKDYVKYTEKDLEEMATGIKKSEEGNIREGYDLNLRNGFILKGTEKKGVVFRNMTEALDEIPPEVWEQKGREREEFLVNASWTSGYFISIGRDVKTEVTIFSEEASKSGSQKNVIMVGPFSKVTITEEIFSADDEARKCVQGKSTYIFLDEGASVDYNYLQDKNHSVVDFTFIRSFQKKDSSFRIFHVNHGSDKVIFCDESYQEGDNSDYRVFGASFSDGTQEIDIRDSSFEIGKHSSADIQVRGVVTGKSSTIHRGNIDIELESVESTGFYDSRILLLSKDGFANSKPGLQIKNANTRSKHASAISSVDSDQILYLESRGIGHNDAITLITGGFIGSLVERSKNKRFQETVEKYAEGIRL
ncbi:MAG: SufD family Fe-S cluster assembly protein [Candidatus Thermoplasmatota archaeon]|jgi:Fe-S cluster assembly protein SufD|nr:SufD family Fe-S cluster assembly protein [Candidatus Thermoplasmatota archaeon]